MTFELDGEIYEYLDHPYNQTRLNERRAEIPVVKKWLDAQKSPCLEIGNVLPNYFPELQNRKDYFVLDKGDESPWVTKADARHYAGGPFQAILSVSTLEHIGIDEGPYGAEQSIQVLHRFKDMLAPKGKLLATIPCGYNDSLDKEFLRFFPKVLAMKRVNARNDWVHCEPKEAIRVGYGQFYPYGNAVLIGYW